MGLQNMKFIVYIDKVMRFLFQQLPSLKIEKQLKIEKKMLLLLLMTLKNNQR